MGDLIMLDAARLRSRSAAAAPVAVPGRARCTVSTLAPSKRAVSAVRGVSPAIREFYFDLACPFSYLAAERVERLLGQAEWVAVASEAVSGSALPSDEDRVRCERRAEELRLPLSWPELSEAGFPSALRIAAFAAEQRAAGRFALAGMRLAFCGGYDLEDIEILAEAAAAAGIGFEPCREAFADPAWDRPLEAAAERLRQAGIKRLPAIRIGDRWFEGEESLAAATELLRNGDVAGSPARVLA